MNRIRSVADYQFGKGCGKALFPKDVDMTYSRKSGRIKHIHLDDVLLASLRARDGVFTLTIAGAERLISNIVNTGHTVTVKAEVAEFIAQRRNVFAKHVLDAGDVIRPGDEVIVLNPERRVLAVGKALLNKEEMLAFETGVAIKVRRGRIKDR